MCVLHVELQFIPARIQIRVCFSRQVSNLQLGSQLLAAEDSVISWQAFCHRVLKLGDTKVYCAINRGHCEQGNEWFGTFFAKYLASQQLDPNDQIKPESLASGLLNHVEKNSHLLFSPKQSENLSFFLHDRWIYRVEATAIQIFVRGLVSSSYSINVTSTTAVASATCLTKLGFSGLSQHAGHSRIAI